MLEVAAYLGIVERISDLWAVYTIASTDEAAA
jgi:hypothetical protein